MACILDDTTIEIIGNDSISGSTSGFQGTETFKFIMIENEIITFTIALNNISGGLPNATLRLYKINENQTTQQIGTAVLNQFNNTFTYDGLAGEYMVCLQSVFPVNYNIQLDFTTYSGVLLQPFLAYNGSTSEATFKEELSFTCQSDVNFKFLHGELPKNFTFRSDGIIFGEAGEQDCETFDWEAPSFVWVESNSNGDLDSTGRPYTFTLRAFLEDYPEVFDDKVFSICVRNNWSKDISPVQDLNAEFECQ